MLRIVDWCRFRGHTGPILTRWQNRHSSPLIDSGTALPAWSEPHAVGSSSPGGSAAGLGGVASAKHTAATHNANTPRRSRNHTLSSIRWRSDHLELLRA